MVSSGYEYEQHHFIGGKIRLGSEQDNLKHLQNLLTQLEESDANSSEHPLKS